MNIFKRAGSLVCFIVLTLTAQAQTGTAGNDRTGIYVDAKGVIRWKSNNSEAAFFGVNYTLPFAYAYRSHKTLGVNHEQAIRQDVYHLARLGIDAFRVHVWDTEISDSLGNLLPNEHLRLFDYLLAELKKRNIKILLTPIAFWGNGYPDKDENTPGFSNIYNKEQVLVTEKAIRAQENYLKQFFRHVNPYTNLSYLNDPDILATEVNNEPRHSGPKDGAKSYVNRMAAAIRSTGWHKPVFYNISESPYYADAVSAADIDGVSFQWYPTGLVANRTLQGNYLPNVDRYTIPFDTIPAFKNKALMVYEFDAGDVLQPVMYPAMARSFRQAGFQWATQFAYDPMATAYANTEYQTHYLNLAYTPSKAISLLIASKVFHRLPRLKNYGRYPAGNTFDVFNIRYKEALSEMNADTEFYYSNSTGTQPRNAKKLQHIAGVGNSVLVNYTGTGAYFLDKLEDGVWRLEVMPDVIQVGDPFERASLKKEVMRVQWQAQGMRISLADLGSDYSIRGLNTGNTLSATAGAGSFKVSPGTWLLVRKGKSAGQWNSAGRMGVLALGEFVAPEPVFKQISLRHEPFREVTAGKNLSISCQLAGADSTAKVTLLVSGRGWQPERIDMQHSSAYGYTAEIPAALLEPGLIRYRIAVRQGTETTVFPAGIKDDPFVWGAEEQESWACYVAAPAADLELFNAGVNKDIAVMNPSWKDVQISYTSSKKPAELIWKARAKKLGGDQILAFELPVIRQIKGRISELSSFDKISVRARSAGQPLNAKITLLNAAAEAFSAVVELSTELRDIEIPLLSFRPDSSLLLPRPYPGFLPLWFSVPASGGFSLDIIEKLQISFGSDLPAGQEDKSYSIEIQSVFLTNREN